MHINANARSVRLSVGELANFRNAPRSDRGGAGPWRAIVGQQWHQTAEQQTCFEYPDAEFEVQIQGRWPYKNWQIELQGRIDQVIPQADGLLLREVKTVRTPLPAPAEELAKEYPEYFAQIACYWRLAQILPDYAEQTLHAELQFININDGTVQSVPLTELDADRFEHQLAALYPFLEDRRGSHLRLEGIELRPAFETLRDGQAELFKTLEKTALQARTVLLEAPTGFGKTGIVLEHALRQMQAGLYERCIYLTSKSTGQLQTIAQLRHMIGDSLRFIQMRNRNEHRIESPAHTCTGDANCDNDLAHHWFAADIHAPNLFEDGTLTLERARALGAETGVCPYALTRGCLPFAEIWIGDSNYVFAPSSQGVFNESVGFEPSKTLLIIDEAHNLPDRVADALSVDLNAGDLLFALEELSTYGANRRLIATGNELVRCIGSFNTTGPISSNELYTALDLCEDFAKQLLDAHIDYEQTAPFAIEIAWRIPELAKRLAEPSHRWLNWSPSSGTLKATCLDPSKWIADCLKPFGASILMSATLAPYNGFRASCGLSKEQAVLAQGHATWRDDAYQVAIDCRVDTRLKSRERYYATTAQTIASLTTTSPGTPVAVFFASYQYAQNVQAYLSATNPELRVMMQPRGVDLAEQESFIEEGLLMADVLFLILGSSYAEGVDKLGGRVHTAMVVGPALPEVNAVQDAKMDAHPSLQREENFRDVYIIPAMRRIHQALGRLVRAPGQSARILLHCQRYAEPAYREQLAPEYQGETELQSDADLANWLQE